LEFNLNQKEVTNMGIVDWTGFNKNDKSGNGAKYLKLEPGKSYRIRPVFKPHLFYKYFVERPQGGFGQAITDQPDSCVIKKKYGEMAKQRFSVNVIDRADGIIKVLEGPMSILKQFADWANATGTDPGSKDGGEFALRVECPGNDRKKTKYIVSFINYTPFTDDEKTMIKSGMHDLESLFKATPQDQIEAKVYGSEDEPAEAPKKKPVASQAAGGKSQISDDFDF
jgi:hypothetical protein